MFELRNVLVATDFGDASDAALQCGRRIARTYGAALHVLHVVEDVYARGLEAESVDMWAEEQRSLAEAAAESFRRRVRPEDAKKYNERIVTRVAANPADAIVDFAREIPIDLIVMGTHGRDAIDPVGIGGVSARVVHAAPCPVLTVKRGADTLAPLSVRRSVAKA